MGLIKTRSLQLLPLQHCFHLPSSSPSTTRNNNKNTIRLIGSDGHVKVLSHPVPASDVMQQHPFHLICRSDSFFIGQKVPTLSAKECLQPGHSYFILPAHFFHSVLSFVTLSSSLLKSSPAAALCSFDVRRTEKGLLQVRLRNNSHCGDDDHDQEENNKRSLVVNSEKLEKEYRQLVGAGKWKPRLETIREKKKKKKSGKMMMLLLNRRKMMGKKKKTGVLLD